MAAWGLRIGQENSTISEVHPPVSPVENAVEAALLVIRSGGSTVAAERTFANILGASQQRVISTVWRLDFIAATRATQSGAATIVRSVGAIGVHLHRASQTSVLGEQVARGEVAVGDVSREIERIKHLPSPYSSFVMTAVAAATGACFTRVIGGDWRSFAIAFVAAGVGQMLRVSLQARNMAVAPVTLLCGVFSALIAAAGLRLGYSQADAATLIASVIYIVPGLLLINGFTDMISYRHLLIGFERMLNAVFLFLVLALAIAFAHKILL